MSANADLSRSILASSIVYHKYAIHRSQAIYMNNNLFQIPNEIRDIFPTYYLLRWQARHFLGELDEGMVCKHEIPYQVIYHNTDPSEVGRIAREGGDVYLSFRSLASEYEAIPTVLIGLTSTGVRSK